MIYSRRMKKLMGIPVSKGIVIGKVFLFLDVNSPEVPRFRIEKDQVESEWARFLAAVNTAKSHIEGMQQAQKSLSGDEDGILTAHIMMLEDPDFHNQVQNWLSENLQNIEWTVQEVSRGIIQKLIASPEAYFRERAVDIADITQRLLVIMLDIKKTSLADLDKDVIVVTRELMPSDAITMNRERVKALLIDEGSRTSHTAILAKSFEIPAVLGLSSVTKEVSDGDTLIVDANTGEVFIHPTAKKLEKYAERIREAGEKKNMDDALRTLPAETKDGYRVTLNANIEFPEEAETSLRYGAEGIGLYRSEFLFLNAGRAEEEEQFAAYSSVVKVMDGRPVTIRTVDVGGDKILASLRVVEEKNPLLGLRAVRFSLAHPEVFKVQLRAILRASIFGPVKIMFPMISGLQEFEQALAVLEEAKAECRKQGLEFSSAIETGCMIEVPAAAIIADILAEKAAFFSIGTNDLVQYSLAIDRNNELVSYLSQPFHPAILRFIKRTIDEAHTAGIKAAMCGELAGDPRATLLLLGLGLDEFSMSASQIPAVKKIIRAASIETCRLLARKALACKTAQEVEKIF